MVWQAAPGEDIGEQGKQKAMARACRTLCAKPTGWKLIREVTR